MTLRHSLIKRRNDLVEGKLSLTERVREIESLLEATKNNLIATDGALQECEHWLSEIEKSNDEEQHDIGV